MRFTYFSAIVLLIVLQGCAPRPIFRMKPQAKHTTFDQGTEYVQRQEKGVALTVSYYRHVSKRFIMDVEIDNNTDSVIRIDPAQFSYDAYGGYPGRKPSDSTEAMASRHAVNPEQELLKKDLAISRSVAHQETSDLIYEIGQVVTLAASFTDSTREQREETQAYLENNAVNHHINNHDRALKRQSLRDQRRAWEVNTLRKTDLFPGEYIRGDVYFKNEPNARGYIFHFNIANLLFNMFFTQQKYVP